MQQQTGQKSPQMKKQVLAKQMHTTMYRNANQGVSASLNQAPRRLNE